MVPSVEVVPSAAASVEVVVVPSVEVVPSAVASVEVVPVESVLAEGIVEASSNLCNSLKATPWNLAEEVANNADRTMTFVYFIL